MLPPTRKARRLRRALAGLVLFGALQSASPAHADQPASRSVARADGPRVPAARKLLEQGLEAFRRGEYAVAIESFRKGNALDPHPVFVFARAQAQRLAGDCAAAVASYEEFLSSDPPAAQAEAARKASGRCADRPAPRLETIAPPPEAQTREPDPLVSAPAPRPAFYRDTAGNVLLAGGVAGVGVGLWAVIGARVPDPASVTYGEYADASDRAQFRRTWGWVGVAAGTGFLAGAVLRYHAVAVRSSRSGLSAQVIAPSGGLGFAVGGSF